MRSKDESAELIEELNIRFDHKPRKCKKINDSGIGTSQRIVSISNGTFFYYPKIQEFIDRDFDKLKYVVPKAGVKLQQIIQLQFPPRQKNERNYFSITLPRNKILKYSKNLVQKQVDRTAEGQQTWTFVFDYDILSLPEIQRRAQKKMQMQSQKIKEMKRKQEEQIMKNEQERKRKIQQQYESLLEAEKAMNMGQDNQNNQYNKNRLQKQKKQELERKIKQCDEYYFMEIYERGYKNFNNLQDQINYQIDLLEAVGNFTSRAQKVVKKYIDQMPFIQKPLLQTLFLLENLYVIIGDSKDYNHQFLENCSIAHHIYNIRKQIRPNFRVPLYCFIKYKGFKILVRSKTPIDDYKGKTLQEKIQHGKSQQTWKTHFLISDDLSLIIQDMNLKPYSSQVSFQKATIHFGKQLKVVQTNQDPFRILRQLDQQRFKSISRNKITYMLNLKHVYPIDLDLENNIDQIYVRLRPQFVQSFQDKKGQKIKLTGGGLTYEYEDQEGEKNDLLLAKASQSLKFQKIFEIVNDLDELKYILSDSHHLGMVLKQQGINIRYIGNIYKLTSLPYIRQMMVIEGIAREIKKIFRDHQKEFVLSHFRQAYLKQIREAFNEKQIKSVQDLKKRQLRKKQNQLSIANAIDYLNLIFGNGHETEAFWEIILKEVKKNYKIQYSSYEDLPHGYLLKTVLYHCGFDIKLTNSIVLFATPNPFTVKDWIKFTSKCSSFYFPNMEVYKRVKISENMTKKEIVNRLQLLLYIKRILNKDQTATLSKLALYVPNVQIPGSKFTIQNLLYHIQTPSKQKFQTTYEICSFIMPPNHPFFQQLYLQFAKINDLEPIMLKKAAQTHAIRSLGITHWRTSQIFSGFKEQAYLTHLIAAEDGIQFSKKISLYQKIIHQQNYLGKLLDAFNYTKKAISFVCSRKQKLKQDQLKQYYSLLKIGMQATYQLRKIDDMTEISEYFWNALLQYSLSEPCHDEIEYLLRYIFRGYMQKSKKKYYLFKLALVFEDRFSQIDQKQSKEQKQSREEYLSQLQEFCIVAKNHKNFIQEMLTKLEFGYSQINFEPDFFTNFWQHVERQGGQELDEGLYEFQLLMRVYGLAFLQEALLNRAYTFDKKSNWNIPHIEKNNIAK